MNNLRRTAYRKLLTYGLKHGQRINSVSMTAAGWFWQIHAAADDYGNLPADPYLCRIESAPRRRELTDVQVGEWIIELAGPRGTNGHAGPLVRRYTAEDGEEYLHICGFTAIQTSPNGRQRRRWPPSPFESQDHVFLESGLQQSQQPQEAQPAQSQANQGDPGKPGESGGTPENQAPPPPAPEPEPLPEPASVPDARQAEQDGGAGEVDDGDGVGAAGERRRKLYVAAALERAGVRGSVVRQIQNIPGLTAEHIQAVCKRLSSEPDIRNLPAVLIRRLRDGRWGDVA